MYLLNANLSRFTGNVPPKANLGDLRGLAGGLNAGGSVMIDGMDFDGAKAYKDSKVSVLHNLSIMASLSCLFDLIVWEKMDPSSDIIDS